MRIDVLTLFPAMFAPVLGMSIMGRAAAAGHIQTCVHDIRHFTKDKHRKCDDYPLGGGPGLVMTAQPVVDAVRSVDGAGECRRIFLSPRGRVLSQPLVRDLALERRLLLLCGHYEGIDQRALDVCGFEEISIGDYVLTGGELPAMVLIDSVARYVPGVLGSAASLEEESHASGLLEAPQYTHPAVWEGINAPEVLLGGNHARIAEWRRAQSLLATRDMRPELLEAQELSYADLRLLDPGMYTLCGKVVVQPLDDRAAKAARRLGVEAAFLSGETSLALAVTVDKKFAGVLSVRASLASKAGIDALAVAPVYEGTGLDLYLLRLAHAWARKRGLQLNA